MTMVDTELSIPKKRPFTAHDADDDAGPLPSDPGTPPPAKRRFFLDGDETVADDIKSEQALPDINTSPLAIRSSQPEGPHDDFPSRRRCPDQEPARILEHEPQAEEDSGAVAFDQQTFEAFVGAKVPRGDIEIIRQHCGNSLERAVNMFFDGTYKKLKRKPTVPFGRQPNLVAPPHKQEAEESQQTTNPHSNIPSSRYVGAFGVEGWATCSGRNLLKHGDVVQIERQKAQAPQRGKGARGIAATFRRADILVRFTKNGSEIGRLAKENAAWVSTLIDQRICKFEGTVVYAPDVLRTNETVFLQLHAYFVDAAFQRAFSLADDRKTGLFEAAESAEEKELRMRQVALVKLFQEINLLPTSGNAAAAANQRQGLLQAAELTDRDPQKPALTQTKPVSASGGTTPEGEDAEEGDGQVLEQDQLDALYKKAQSFDFNTPEAEPADTFAMSLRPYQKQALHWMIKKERDEQTNRESSMHPLWEEYTWPVKDADDKDLPQFGEQTRFYVNPYSGELSLEFPVQEQHCLGGILADEMGLGKTIQMLSLIHSHRSEVALRAKQDAMNGTGSMQLQRLPASSACLPAPCTTLVVAPMSLLAQWHSEAEKASKEGTMKALVYYGNEKLANLRSVCCEANASTAPDVIITSYGVVLSEFNQVAARKGDHNGLFSVKFFRVILDEAHNIKNRQSKTAKACYEIAAEHRWLLTGTPIVNRLEDLFSLVRFLRVEPWNNFSFWRTFITVPFESKNFVRALDVVQTVLEPLVLRRTKDMKTPDGQPLVPLPLKHVEIVSVELSDKERGIYDYVFNKAKDAFRENFEAGTVMKSFTAIFAQILRLRQTCCHPVLVRHRELVADEEDRNAVADAATGLADDMDLETLIQGFTAEAAAAERESTFEAHVLQQIRDEAANECPICAEEPMEEQTVASGCWHSTCKKCILDYIKYETDRAKTPTCVQCRKPIGYRDLFEVIRYDDEVTTDAAGLLGEKQQPRIALERIGVKDSSSKITALISHLRAIRREHPRMKSVVFSQFTSFLNLIEPALARAKMPFLRLDGTMAQKARAAVLDQFRDETRGFTVLLISLRAGGVGLNLTSAGRVFMMDPWWSFAVEAQAIDRVHRMGQTDEVRVVRFIVKDSVEERMLKVQDRKKFIATSLGMMNDEEKKMQRIEDIKELLS